MAEINVKPKSKTPGWVWIILLIIAVALLYFFLRGTGENTDKQDSGADSSTSIIKEHSGDRQAVAVYASTNKVPAA